MELSAEAGYSKMVAIAKSDASINTMIGLIGSKCYSIGAAVNFSRIAKNATITSTSYN